MVWAPLGNRWLSWPTGHDSDAPVVGRPDSHWVAGLGGGGKVRKPNGRRKRVFRDLVEGLDVILPACLERSEHNRCFCHNGF